MKSNWKQKTPLFLASQAVSLFGSSLVQFAMVWYVTLKTSSGFWVSMLTVCAYLPQFLISFFAGVWADRHSKKWLIIIADASIAITTLALALAIPYISKDTVLLSFLLIVSAIRSVGTGIQTPAVSSMIPQLVPEKYFMRVNGINSTIQSIVQFAAPAAAGVILTFYTLRTTLLIDIVTAMVGIGLLSCIVMPKQGERVIGNSTTEDAVEETTVFKELISGVKYAFSDRFLRNLLLLNGVFIFLCVPAGFLATLFVSRTYGDSYTYFTIVELVGFAGMTVGGLLMGTWGGFKSRIKTLMTGLFAFGVLAIGMGAVKIFIVYLVFMFVYGIALTMIQTATTTLLQEKSKLEMTGRVFGFFGAIYSAALPLGMVVFGPMADVIPMQWIMIGSGAALIVLGIVYSGNKLNHSGNRNG
ncbi:MAG: MFS transporter [Lachnospiraceae bacterium]|nr:MFS transporter [Lachnospiraceae bacterium]MDD3617249.1 MFS transporter [Lachnospiraceae bacterium]